MNSRQLELLRHVVDAGSLTGAARRAGISQPAVSQAMAALARELKEPLFLRQGRGLQPTERALSLAQAARAAQRLLDQAGPTAGRSPRVMRAGLAPAAGLMFGPEMVRTHAECAPGTLLSIVTGPAAQMLEQLVQGELDLVIAPRPRGLQRADLRQAVMYTSQPVVYGRLGHPLAGAGRLRDIARAEWAVAGSAGTPGNVIEEAFRVRGWAAPRIAVQCADYAMLLRLLASTELLGVVSHPALVPAPRRQGLAPIPVAEGLPHYEVCLFWWEPRTRPGPRGLGDVIARLLALAETGL